MNLLQEFENIKTKLGEKLDYKEYCEIKRYLEEHPKILLVDIYNDLNIKDQFNAWRLDNAINNRKVFAVVYKDNQMQIDYLKIEPYKFSYTDGRYIYNKNHLFASLEEAKSSLKYYREGYIYTDKTNKYINSNFIDKKELVKTLYGRSDLQEIYCSKVNDLKKQDNIEKIYKVDNKVLDKAWYLIKDKNENRFLLRFDVKKFEKEFNMNDYILQKEYEEINQEDLNIIQYDLNTSKEYNQMIFNYLIEFKNKVEEEYFKLNLNRNQIVEVFIEKYSDFINKKTKEYIDPNSELNKDENLFKCFVTNVKNDIRDEIQSEINKLEFSNSNYYINENNIENFINEFTKKAIYGCKEVSIKNDLKDIDFEEEMQIENNKINFYFANADYLFEIPKSDNEMYFDGYLTINLINNSVEVDIVGITDNDERYYYTYKPTKEESKILIKASEAYCEEYSNQTLNELLKECEEEETNEQ